MKLAVVVVLAACGNTGYSSNLNQDGPWARAILGPTDIWEATLTP